MPTAIEWTEETWNPVTGCSHVSEGCDHCYAETLTERYAGTPDWIAEHRPWTHENAAHNVVLHPERLDKPLSWRKPRVVFVNSMSDLFHELIPPEFIEQVFVVMARASRHTFQVLTKRPKRMAEVLSDPRTRNFIVNRASSENATMHRGQGWVGTLPAHVPDWPLPNVWLGTSIESWRFNYRADQLRRAPAAVRFISAEPLLDTLYPGTDRDLDLTDIDWVIAGGESGPGFRPMDPEWARELRDACFPRERRLDYDGHGGLARPPAFFFKQWGGRTPKAGGRLLDGRTWDEMPGRTAVAA